MSKETIKYIILGLGITTITICLGITIACYILTII